MQTKFAMLYQKHCSPSFVQSQQHLLMVLRRRKHVNVLLPDIFILFRQLLRLDKV